MYRIPREETFAERQARVKAQTQAEMEAEARANVLRQARMQANAERQASAVAERQARARAEFEALGKEIAKATTRAELVELGQKRADLAPYTGVSYVYTNHCWNCKEHISSDIHAQCSACRFYICSSCGSCLC
jgi:hypothetical protein